MNVRILFFYRYDSDVQLTPGTLMTIYKCPVEACKKRSCTDIKSFKLHCLHIHKNKEILPLVEEVEARSSHQHIFFLLAVCKKKEILIALKAKLMNPYQRL